MYNVETKKVYQPKIDVRIYDKSYYVRLLELPKNLIEKQWSEFDWEKAEEIIARKQKILARETYRKNFKKVKTIQYEIVKSFEARMLAVKRVSETFNSAGVDGVRWKTDYDKMKAVYDLEIEDYKASPLRNFVLKDKKSGKERNVGILTLRDRAMQYLWVLALEPVAEALGDKNSFGFRKGRGPAAAHAHLMDALTDYETGSWVFVGDVYSFYASISHIWLLNNIPMDKHILNEFLKAGMVFPNGEFFPTEEGISLGSALSTIIGNMVLDGLQKKLYEVQGENITDYKNGWILRFADDFIILAKSEKDAMIFRDIVIEFLEARGLKLSYSKSKIINLNTGEDFTFLSRTYYKKDGIIHCKPSEASKEKFRENFEEFLFDPNKKWTPKKIITEVNQKLNGWASYHRITEAKDDFNELDSFVSACLFRLLQKLYPKLTRNEIKKRFYSQAADGRYIFSLASNRDYKVINLVDVLLIKSRKIDTSKNYFIERWYFDSLNEKVEIENVTGRYKELWDRQGGKCAICNMKILTHHPRKVIFKRLSKDTSINNMMYIHKKCQDSELTYIYADVGEINARTTMDIINEIQEVEDGNKVIDKPSKFDKLKVYFQNENKKKITLTYAGIERILGSKLCKSAYQNQNYFYNKDNIAKAWMSQNYRITKFDLENQKITFEKAKRQKAAVPIPKFMFEALNQQQTAELEMLLKKFARKHKLRL